MGCFAEIMMKLSGLSTIHYKLENSWLSVPLFVTLSCEKKKYTISKGMQLTQPCQGFGAWKVIGNDLFLQNTLHKKERQVFTHWCNPQITIWRTKATRCRLKLPNLPPNLDHLAWSNERFIRTQAVGKDLISEKLAGCGRSGLPNF